MSILVIDIGCTHTKTILFKNGQIDSQLKVKTPAEAEGIVVIAGDLTHDILREARLLIAPIWN